MMQDRAFRSPPKLLGYCFDPHEAFEARARHRLLSMRLEVSRACDLKCIYCYGSSGEALPNELGYAEVLELIEQAQCLGAKSIVLTGGEPMIYPRFFELVDCIASLGMVPVIFTNTVHITTDAAEHLWETGASVITKLDSLKPNTQDYLATQKGIYEKIGHGFGNLMEAGFTDGDPDSLRLGASFVTNRMNIREVPDIWKYCRDRNIYPNMEVLTYNGRARTIREMIPSLEEIRDLKLKLLEIDRGEYGLDWLPYMPLTASGCLQMYYSCYVTSQGWVRPCAGIHTREGGNVRERTLKDILDSDFFGKLRSTDKYLQGKCRRCDHLDECHGCRAKAFTEGEGLFGEDPTCWYDI